jgi:hypothetical protein
MAAIDFPASPTNGQLFTPANGITYKFQTTPAPGLWVAISGSFGDGHVTATGGLYVQQVGVDTLIPFQTIVSGNSGNWWNTSTSRYTPPAGKYWFYANAGTQAPTAANGTWALKPRKNGVVIPNCGVSGSGGQTLWIGLTCGVYVDANGTDYFEWVANQAIAGMNAQGGNMSAFRIG